MVTFQKMRLLVLSLLFSACNARLGCDFTQGGKCDWDALEPIMNENFKWQLYDPTSNDKSNMTYSDATSLDFSFMYVTWEDGNSRPPDNFSAKALMGPTMARAQSIDHCLQLKYRMFGPRVGALKIHYNVLYGSDEPVTHTIFEKSGNQGEEWQEVQIPVAAESPVDYYAFLMVEVNGVANWHGEVAVAHLFFEEGECLEKESVNCSFAESCGYHNYKDLTDATDWLVDTVKSGNPKTDHTSGTKYGKFAQVFLDKKPFSKELQSPRVRGSKFENCVRFYFYLGEGSSLQMGVLDGMGSHITREWLWSSRETDPRNEWVFAEITLLSNSPAIVFRAQKSIALGSTVVAIDDIEMSRGSCKIRGNNYFEHGSGLYSSEGDFDWIVVSSKSFQGTDLKDHTQETTGGHFALALFDGETQGNKAKLISPTFRRGEVSCLQFNFHFSDKNVGELNIHYLNDPEKFNWSAIASITNKEITSYGDEWNVKKIKLLRQERKFQVVFEAVAGSKGFGYIAIDDIIFSDRSCIDQDSQISWTPVLPAREPGDADCNFEDKNLCQWKESNHTNLHLEIATADRPSGHPGKDHSGKRQGVVLLTPSTKSLVGLGEIISPQLRGSNEGQCLSLWYYISGRGVSIQVFTALGAQSEDTLLWQRLYDEGYGWQLAEIALDVKENFQIKIRVKKLSEEGTAAIDDILYSPKGCKVKKINAVDTCDFETGLCEMKLSSDSDRSWTLYSGSLKEKGGPDRDNTYQTEKGHFLLFNQSSSKAGDTAIQVTPTFDVGSDPGKGGQMCLRFYYLMYGPDVGTLEITFSAGKDNWNNYLWRASGNHGKYWIPAEAQVDVDEDSQVEIDFQAIAGDGQDGMFGIDDIELRHGACSTPGSCTFSNFDSCGWHQNSNELASSRWYNYENNNEYGIAFKPGQVTINITDSMISEQFEGGQVHCIHFGFAQLAGKGITSLRKVTVSSGVDEQLLWRLFLAESTSFKERPARVTVYSERAYQIHLSAEAHSTDFFIEVNNILVTNQPCLAEPAEAVSFDCDFTEGTCFWYQDLVDDSNWVVSEDGPFAHLKLAYKTSKAVGRLWSPIIPAGVKCLNFTSLQYGENVGYLKLWVEAGYRQVTYIDWQGGETISKWQVTAIDVTSDDNYQLVFEGMCETGYNCYIGITDIQMSSSGCPSTWKSDSENPRCTFESKSNPLCGWTVSSPKDVPDFTWRHEGGLDKKDVNAPSMDFTFGGAGHYAYVSPPSSLGETSFDELKTTLTSPKLQSQEDYPYCMIFAYNMKGPASGTLNVYQVGPGATGYENTKPLWTAFVSDNIWRKGFASLQKIDDFQVVFEAVATTQTSEGLAVDEIYFQRGPCKTWEDKCDFTDDLCLWSNEENGTDTFDWERHDHEHSLDKGPTEDHGGKGYFLIASSHFSIKDEKAKLLSTMHYPSSNISNMCLQFFYFMSGKDGVVLDVNVLRGFENSKQPETSINLWKLQTNNTTKEWLKATVKLDDFLTGKPFKLEFEASMVNGTVAIDDVEIISRECETTPDEAVSTALVVAEASCTFDMNMCGWENAPTDPTAPKWKAMFFPTWNTSPLGRRGPDHNVLSVTFSRDDKGKVAIFKSQTLPPTSGLECLHFWYSSRLTEDSLTVKISLRGSKTVIWKSMGQYGYKQAFITIFNIEPFQIYFEAQGDIGYLLIDTITIDHGPCKKRGYPCKFRFNKCGYTEDSKNDYGWKIIHDTRLPKIKGVQPSVGKHTANETTRLKSLMYGGGWSYCFKFSYFTLERMFGKMRVYAQEVGGDLGQPLWNMPYLKSLDIKDLRSVSVPVSQAKPFQIVFEHKAEATNGASPIITESQMLTRPCEPLGSCDFEGNTCSYLTEGWRKIIPSIGQEPKFPAVDHTYGVNDGSFLGARLEYNKVVRLISPILPQTNSSCLTLAYALTGSACLKVYKNVDGVGKILLTTISNTTVQGQVIVWNELEIDFEAEENYVVVIEVQNKEDDGSTASVDDIKTLPGSCAMQTSTKTEKKAKLEIIRDLSCNFEDKSKQLCNFKIGKEKHGSWKWTLGMSNSPELSFDHTKKDNKGAYVNMFAYSDAKFAEAELEILSQETTKPGCLSFWYHMSGNALNTLRVYTGERSPLWEKTNQENVVWQHAQLDFVSDAPKTTQDFNTTESDEDFFSFRFEGVLIPNDGHVAIDDIEVSTGRCLITDTCTFEENGQCNFIASNYSSGQWMRKKAGDVLDDTSLQPFTDHTYGTTEGHFMYCCSQTMDTEFHAELISPVYKGNSDGRCLVIWTRIIHSIIPGSLSVKVLDKEGLFFGSINIYKNKSWKMQYININSKTDFQIIFTASGRKSSDQIALDDIQVTSGPCHELYGCDFSTGFCTWTPRQIKYTTWQISWGLHDEVGPRFDHTTETVAGQYILMQGISSQTSTAYLESERIVAAGPRRRSRTMCFSFWYQGAGSLLVALEGSKHHWGPYHHDEDNWVHQMMTLPFIDVNGTGTMITLKGFVPRGKKKFLAVDDIELLSIPCEKIQHEREFSCGDKTRISFAKVCDFKSDCSNGKDEQECGSCTFENSQCGFVDVSEGQGWKRQLMNPLETGPAANASGVFFYYPFGQSKYGSFETPHTFPMTSSSCELQLKAYLYQGGKMEVYAKTHMNMIKLDTFYDSKWDPLTVFIGNINVPFKLVFITELGDRGSGIGIDDIKMVDCGFPLEQRLCMRNQFHCSNKACIFDYKVCDFHNDCGDLSDESDCQNYIRDDFDYSLGSWTNEVFRSTYSWQIVSTPNDRIQMDHTQGSLRGGVLRCYSYLEPYYVHEANCRLASPMLQATDGTKTCQIRLFYATGNSSNMELNIHTRVNSSVTEVPHKSVKAGNWNRVLATLSVATDFQIIISGTVQYAGLESGNFLFLDDISLTDGCILKNDVSTTLIPPNFTILEEHTEVFFLSTQSSTSSTTDGRGTGRKDTQDPDTRSDTTPGQTIPQDTNSTPGKKTPQHPHTTPRENVPQDTTAEGGGKSEKSQTGLGDSPKKNEGSWQLPLGISLGVIGLAAIVVLAVIYLRRTNKVFWYRKSIPFVNELYNEGEEPQEMEVTNYCTNDLTPDMFGAAAQSTGRNVLSLDNPSYEEFEG